MVPPRRRTLIKDLPPEILSKIFVRFPMKYLMRLRFVCKDFDALIRSPEFRRVHLEDVTLKNDPDYLLMRNRIGDDKWGFYIYSATTFAYDVNSGLPRSIDIPMVDNGIDLNYLNLLNLIGFDVYGSCNGLLCISLPCVNMNSILYLCNPSIRKLKVLPQSRFRLPEGTIITTNDTVTLGLGYHSGKDDYQLVRFVHPNKSFFHAEFYSLKLNSWTTVENVGDPRGPYGWFMKGCSCLDGVIYWHLMRDKMSLVSFDMGASVLQWTTLHNSEQMLPVMRPNCLQVLNSECLWMLNGKSVHEYHVDGLQQLTKSLPCLLQDIMQGCAAHHLYDIRVLKEDTEERISRIQLPALASIAWPLGFSLNGEFSYLVISDDESLYKYDLQQQLIQADITPIVDQHAQCYVDAYRENLVLLD